MRSIATPEAATTFGFKMEHKWSFTTGNDNIDIANVGIAGESAKVRDRHRGNAQEHLYRRHLRSHSSTRSGRNRQLLRSPEQNLFEARFKDNIKPMEKASEAILALQPVTFRYKHEL